MVWKIDDPQGNEAAKIRWELVPYTRGRVLDLGCGPSKAFPHFIGVDNGHHEVFGQTIKPDLRIDTCEKLDLIASQSCDAVFSSHLLEHIEDYKAALREWWRVVKVGGHLCLYLPHKSLYPNVGTEGANPDHKHDFLPDDIVAAMREIGSFDLVRNEDRDAGREYSFYQVYRKLDGKKRHLFSHAQPKPAKTCAVIRYGAFGDVLQASSILPHLKAQGYHVTFYTVPKGHDCIRHDPNVDAWIIQDHEQVPNHLLGDFWDNERQKYDLFINLSESVEGTWLALPGRSAHGFPHAVRAKYMDANYLEFLHDMAGMPQDYRSKFYPTADESEWARKECAKLGGPVILYVLSGSSVHKTWPHMDALLARILYKYPAARIVTAGGELEQILEIGWEKEPRVVCKAGKWTIRQTLAIAQQADIVFGPETGVLSGVAFEPNLKIVCLSHSSHNNLTKHWHNTAALAPVDTPCYPCHQMHYGWEHCQQDEETGQAKCMANITVDAVWNAIDGYLRKAA